MLAYNLLWYEVCLFWKMRHSVSVLILLAAIRTVDFQSLLYFWTLSLNDMIMRLGRNDASVACIMNGYDFNVKESELCWCCNDPWGNVGIFFCDFERCLQVFPDSFSMCLYKLKNNKFDLVPEGAWICSFRIGSLVPGCQMQRTLPFRWVSLHGHKRTLVDHGD